MRRVVVTSEGGVVTVTVDGVKGKACKELTKKVEGLLGQKVSEKPTQEMYEQSKQNVNAGH